MFTRFPQAVFAAAAAAALLAHLVLGPLPLPPWPWLQLAGVLLAVIGVNLMLGAVIAMSQRETSPLPWRPTTSLVSHGVFRFSRNPIYLGDVLLVGGLGLWFMVGWLVVAAVVAIPVMNLAVIRHEEAHLADRFPDEWAAYARKVRRWV